MCKRILLGTTLFQGGYLIIFKYHKFFAFSANKQKFSMAKLFMDIVIFTNIKLNALTVWACRWFVCHDSHLFFYNNFMAIFCDRLKGKPPIKHYISGEVLEEEYNYIPKIISKFCTR